MLFFQQAASAEKAWPKGMFCEGMDGAPSSCLTHVQYRYFSKIGYWNCLCSHGVGPHPDQRRTTWQRITENAALLGIHLMLVLMTSDIGVFPIDLIFAARKPKPVWIWESAIFSPHWNYDDLERILVSGLIHVNPGNYLMDEFRVEMKVHYLIIKCGLRWVSFITFLANVIAKVATFMESWAEHVVSGSKSSMVSTDSRRLRSH